VQHSLILQRAAPPPHAASDHGNQRRH
jgi:hypothetical protein